MPAPRKMTSLLADLLAFGQNLGEVPYEQLETSFKDAGYKILLSETGVVPCPDASVLVTFDIMVGRENEPLEKLDAVTMRMAGAPGPVSVAARIAARASVIFMITGRLPPPAPNTAPASDARPAPGPNGREVHIDMGDGDVAIDLPDEPETPPAIKLVERMEPDGLPIMRDFDDIDPREATASEIVEEFITLVDEFMHTASLEQIAAFGSKNSEALGFVTTMGTDAQKSELLGIINARRAQLQPRRRSTAAN